MSRTSNTISSAQRRVQRRATSFRSRNETFRTTKLVGGPRDTRIVREQGNMGLVKHDKIMAALERRALRYRKGNKIRTDHDEVLYNEALDETGTVSTEGLTDFDVESWSDSFSAGVAGALETQELAGVNDGFLEVQGVAPGKRRKERPG